MTDKAQTNPPPCPLCSESATLLYHEGSRRYFQCPNCSLAYAHPNSHLSRDMEKSVYDQHQNDSTDTQYRNFLGRLFTPISKQIKPRSKGLDFGSGPGPTLSLMFEEAGHSMSIYDPFFAPDISVFQKSYDFVSSSETMEHLHNPGNEIKRLWSCIRPGGILGIMTKRLPEKEAFPKWHYKNDPTHVSFFSLKTFEWLANSLNAELNIHDEDVVILSKADRET